MDYLVSILEDNFAVFFTKNNCNYCHYARNYMNSIGYPSFIVDFDDLPDPASAAHFM